MQLFSIGFTFIPIIGAFSIFFGFFGLIGCLFTLRTYRKLEWPIRWPILAIILSLVTITLASENYRKHKEVTNVLAVGAVASSVVNDQITRQITKGIKEDVKEKLMSKAKEQIYSEPSLPEEASNVGQEQADVVNENSGINSEPTSLMYTENTSGPKAAYYYSIVDKLRLRSEPHTDSEVIGHLNFGQQVKYRQMKTDQLETHTIEGIERMDNWYKITPVGTKDSLWVYGGALVNATDSYAEISQSRRVVPYSFISRDSLYDLTGWRTYADFSFSGVITYDDSEANPEGNGQFYFVGYARQDYENIPGYGNSEEVSGMLKDGLLDGLLRNQVYLFESSYDLRIEFQSGQCYSHHLIYKTEEDSFETKGGKLEDCSFDVLSAKLNH